jgi:HlyD family secretion protein
MPQQAPSPYREKSLERLSSPERLDQLLRLVDRKSWLPLATLGVLVLALIVWAIFGEVPVRVHGKGILLRPRDVVEIQAPGSGYVVSLDVQVDQVVVAGQQIARIDRPDLEKQLELQRAKKEELTALSGAAEILAHSGTSEGQGLESHIESTRALAREIRDKALQLLEEERQRLEKQKGVAQDLALKLEQRAEDVRGMQDDEIVSREDVIAAEREYMDSLNEVSRLDGDLRDLQSRALAYEERYVDRLQQLADLKLEMQDYEQQIAEVQREIERLETALEKEARIVAERAGRIMEVSTTVGDFLAPGDRIASMSLSGDDSPFECLVYFTVRDGKRLDPGMPIQVTPDTVERERFGGIVGSVDWISSLPVSLAEAESMVGNRQVAEQLTAGGYLIQVRAGLERDPDAPSRFAWTSSRGPAFGFSPGTTTTARVTVRERRPITFVLPFLRAASGID